MTQHTSREKNLPQMSSALGAPEMQQTHQELFRRQGNKPEREYQQLLPGTPVWVQHRQNATSSSGKPVCTKLLLDHAGKRCRET